MAKVIKKKVTTKRATKNQFKKKNTKSKGFGRPTMTDAEKELSLQTRTQFKTMLNKYMITSKADLSKMYRAKDTPAIDKMLIKSMLKAIESGDQSQINWFLNHSLGKEKETTNMHITGSMENSIDVKKLSKEELLALKELANKK